MREALLKHSSSVYAYVLLCESRNACVLISMCTYNRVCESDGVYRCVWPNSVGTQLYA